MFPAVMQVDEDARRENGRGEFALHGL